MSRREQPKIASMQLFPFMAVLICTMGSLVMLLVVIARQSSASGNAKLQADAQQHALTVHEAQEVVEFQADQLLESRSRTEAQVAEKRLRLSHLEDHSRRLREEFARLQTSARQLQQVDNQRQGSQQVTLEELQRVRQQLADADRALSEARKGAQDQQSSYSVVPYEGRNQTRRRPIYIECRSDAVVLQPEGIVLTEEDFAGPMGAGNPLASALRAMREQLAAQAAGGLAEEPYALLLVRPDGIPAYYAARAALTSWGSEFGYELIGEDWKLEFPPADPVAAESTERVVAEARLRQRALARAAPRSYDRGRGSARGGHRSGGFGDGRPAGGGFGSGSPGGAGAGGSHGALTSSGPGNAGEHASGPSGTKTKRYPASAGAKASQSWEGDPTAIASLESAQNGTKRTSQPGGEPANGEASGSARDGTSKPDQTARNLSKTRGANWGLPEAAQRAVPMTRPITVECYADRLVIVPDGANSAAKQIVLGTETEDSIDELVSSVWQHMKGWGIAGRNLYWRPTLVMKVAPNAGGRYAELKALLQDSGLDVQQKGEDTANANNNPLRR